MKRTPRTRLRTRLVAMLGVVAFLAGLGVDVHALVMGHGAGHGPAAAADDDRVGHHAAGCHQAMLDESPSGPTGPWAHGCCPAAACSAGASPPPAGPDVAAAGAGDDVLNAMDLTGPPGLQHPPPLRPPR